MKRTSLFAASAIVALTAAALPASAQAPTASVVLGFNGGYRLYNPNGTVQTGLEPPDTDGAVGTSQFGVFINGGYAVYDKNSGALQGTLGTDQSFWQAAGLGGNSDVAAGNLSDTRLVYDASTSHWFASEITTPTSTNANQFLVAVSNSSNLLDGFKGYAYNANTAGGTRFADYDTLGINSVGVYLGANMFNANGSSAGTDSLAISKADLIAGAATPSSSLFYNVSANSTGFTSHPVIDLDNGGTTANSGQYFISSFNTTRDSISQVTGQIGNGATLTTGGGNVTVTGYTGTVPGAPQPGSTVLIDAGDTRISGAPVKANGIIYAAQTVRSAAGLDAIRIVGVNAVTKATVLDQLISDPSTSYYYPSLAVNGAGQMVIGFTASSTTQYASSEAIVGQLNGIGTAVTFGAPILLKAGLAPYANTRWGDYSATYLDPTNPFKFWTIQEYAEATPSGTNGNWSTWVSAISIAATPEPSQTAAFGLGLLGLGGLALRARRKRSA